MAKSDISKLEVIVSISAPQLEVEHSMVLQGFDSTDAMSTLVGDIVQSVDLARQEYGLQENAGKHPVMPREELKEFVVQRWNQNWDQAMEIMRARLEKESQQDLADAHRETERLKAELAHTSNLLQQETAMMWSTQEILQQQAKELERMRNSSPCYKTEEHAVRAEPVQPAEREMAHYEAHGLGSSFSFTNSEPYMGARKSEPQMATRKSNDLKAIAPRPSVAKKIWRMLGGRRVETFTATSPTKNNATDSTKQVSRGRAMASDDYQWGALSVSSAPLSFTRSRSPVPACFFEGAAPDKAPDKRGDLSALPDTSGMPSIYYAAVNANKELPPKPLGQSCIRSLPPAAPHQSSAPNTDSTLPSVHGRQPDTKKQPQLAMMTLPHESPRLANVAASDICNSQAQSERTEVPGCVGPALKRRATQNRIDVHPVGICSPTDSAPDSENESFGSESSQSLPPPTITSKGRRRRSSTAPAALIAEMCSFLKLGAPGGSRDEVGNGGSQSSKDPVRPSAEVPHKSALKKREPSDTKPRDDMILQSVMPNSLLN